LPLDGEEIERLYFVEQLSMDEIGQRLGADTTTIYRRLEERGVARRGDSESHVYYPRRDFSGDPLEKAYLIGFRLGDLHVMMNNDGPGCASIVISTSSTRVEQLSLFHELFSPYGHVNVTSPRKDGACAISCHLNLAFDFLLHKQDDVPEWILCSAQDCRDMRPFIAFLAGYTDAEGSFCVPIHGRAQFQLESYDVSILRQIHAVLNDWLSVTCPPLHLAHPKGYCAPNGSSKCNSDSWRLNVYRKSSLNRLCELLEPHLKHAKRRADMYAVWANVIARGVEH
jgi:hypothetical protein